MNWAIGLRPNSGGRASRPRPRALVEYRFETSDIAALTSGYFAANAASARVLEKIGFSETGRSRRFSQSNGAEIPHVDMLLTRAQWEAS